MHRTAAALHGSQSSPSHRLDLAPHMRRSWHAPLRLAVRMRPRTYRRSAALCLLALAVHLHIVFATYAPCIAQPLLYMAASHRLAIATTSHRTCAALGTHRSASPCGLGRAPTVALLLRA